MIKVQTTLCLGVRAAAAVIACGMLAHAQLSSSAYRVLGQPDFQQNGVNMVEGVALHSPSGLALDSRDGQVHLYIADTSNNRVLGWQDAHAYQNGDSPSVVLGQATPTGSAPFGIGTAGLNAPLGMAVNPATGDLYVADTGNSRVLRFPNPFANMSRNSPDAVYGQAGFSSFAPSASESTLNKPRAVAFDPAGNLWICDTGNHRLLRFSAAVLANPNPQADIVIGQKDFSSASANAAGAVSAAGFDTPSGLAFDAQGNLYVADYNNARVLRFGPPLAAGGQASVANAVWGQNDFKTRSLPPRPSAASLAGPFGIAVDGHGSLYVAVPADNRVLVFPTGQSSGTATLVLGQNDFTTTTANSGAAPQASEKTFFALRDIKIDTEGTVFAADSGNNRVLAFAVGSKSANRVWGQLNFSLNGPNEVKPSSINAVFQIAVDYSRVPFALYVSDVSNSRVLGWKDSVRFRSGDPADFVIGQRDLYSAAPNADTPGAQTPTATSLAGPAGMVVDQSDGSLYIADSANNRVLRYPRPVDQSGRITPDMVLGQPDFTSNASAVVSAASLHAPSGVAFGPDGHLFVADTGNNRVLEFPAHPAAGTTALRIYGQLTSDSSNAGSQVAANTLSGPEGIFVDSAATLYVADTGNNRVLVFPNTAAAPQSGIAAAFVIGQTSFTASSAGRLRGPAAVAVDSTGAIYVSDTGNNRVLQFPSLAFLPATGGVAVMAMGQRDLNGTVANWNASNGAASAEGLFAPLGIYIDRQDTLYVGDAGNSRVLHYLKNIAVVNAATFQSGVAIAPGALITLFGSALATQTVLASGSPWPINLAQRTVLVNDNMEAPAYFWNAMQANVQLPQAAPPGSDRIAITDAGTGELIAGTRLLVAAAAPGLFTGSQDGKGQAAALNQDGSLNGATNAAPRGTTISLFGTGQGSVSPAVPDGAAAPPGSLSKTVAVPTSDAHACLTSQPSMCVAIGSSFANVQFSGLAPGFVGLWQINVQIPPDAAPGNASVRVVVDGVPSNIVTVAVR